MSFISTVKSLDSLHGHERWRRISNVLKAPLSVTQNKMALDCYQICSLCTEIFFIGWVGKGKGEVAREVLALPVFGKFKNKCTFNKHT